MLALEGVRVIDLAGGVAGGYCTRLLAGLGADVLKVERPRTGDVLRRTPPFAGAPSRETAAIHLHLNAGKRSITLDAATPTGASLLARLLARAGVLITGVKAPAPAGDPASLAARWPELIHVSVTPLGATGPRAAWRAPELIAFALSGYLSLNGDPDREPVKLYGSQAELQGGLHAALAVAVAIIARERGAPAQHADVSCAEAAGSLLSGALARHALMRRPQVRNGPRPAGFGPERLYPSTVRPCADGHVHVHCHNRFPDLLSVLMDAPRLAAPGVMDAPLGHADEIDALIDGWLATRTRGEAVAEAQELRIPMTEVLDPREVVADAAGHHAARGAFVRIAHPVAGDVLQPGAPLRPAASPWRVARAPLLGEHNAPVFSGDLGIAPRALARLAAAGVI